MTRLEKQWLRVFERQGKLGVWAAAPEFSRSDAKADSQAIKRLAEQGFVIPLKGTRQWRHYVLAKQLPSSKKGRAPSEKGGDAHGSRCCLGQKAS